jgi:hypothetical protein
MLGDEVAIVDSTDSFAVRICQQEYEVSKIKKKKAMDLVWTNQHPQQRWGWRHLLLLGHLWQSF